MCRVAADVKDRIVDDVRVERERGDVDGGERGDERARVRRDVAAHRQRQRQRALARARALAAAAHRQQVCRTAGLRSFCDVTSACCYMLFLCTTSLVTSALASAATSPLTEMFLI